MKTIHYLSIIILSFSSQILLAQNERNKIVSSSVMNKEEIQKTGCRDLYCLLRRINGITFADGSVRIRASVSLNSPSNPLVVVDGIPMDLSVLNTIPVEDASELKVLKDAGEYRVKGANGAIVIKTGK